MDKINSIFISLFSIKKLTSIYSFIKKLDIVIYLLSFYYYYSFSGFFLLILIFFSFSFYFFSGSLIFSKMPPHSD